MITKLLKSLAQYYNLENDLSNVVCILCNIDTEFKEVFIHYFFEDLDINSVGEIKREIYAPNRKDSRVDLYFVSDRRQYIIEVKIGDKNHHFGQYEEAFKVTKERFGYITNYYCHEGNSKGYNVKEWDELYLYLEKDNKTRRNKTISGFLAYLKDVCGILSEPIQNIGDENFIRTISEGILKHPQSLEATERFQMEITDTVQRRENSAVNFYVSFPPRDSNKNFLWCGIKPMRDDNRITFSVELTNREKHHQPSLSKKLLNIDPGKFKYAEPPIMIGDYVYFNLRQELQKEFDSATDYMVQKKILRQFINEVTCSLNEVLSEKKV